MTKVAFPRNPSPLSPTEKKMLAPQHYVINSQGYNVQSGPGVQTYIVFPWADYNVLHAIGNLSPNAPTKACRYLLEEWTGETQYANAAVTTCIATFYDIVLRKDASLGISGSTDLGSPGTAWSVGAADEGVNNEYTYIGSTPFESDLFNTYYKVVQSTKVVIAPGGIHTHKCHADVNKIIRETNVEHSAYGLAGVTCYTMVVVQGQPAHDSATNSSVTISGASLDCIAKATYKFRFMQESAVDVTRVNNLANAFAVGEQHVNEEVGQVQDSGGLHPGTLIS